METNTYTTKALTELIASCVAYEVTKTQVPTMRGQQKHIVQQDREGVYKTRTRVEWELTNITICGISISEWSDSITAQARFWCPAYKYDAGKWDTQKEAVAELQEFFVEYNAMNLNQFLNAPQNNSELELANKVLHQMQKFVIEKSIADSKVAPTVETPADTPEEKTYATTTKVSGADACHLGCRGMNHESCSGYHAKCDKCGSKVIQWLDKNGKKKQVTELGNNFCFSTKHECTESQAASYKAHLETEGIPTKGQTVVVVKGRKVPKGTTGKVFWVATGLDGYGVQKIGFTTEAGEKHFTNILNVEIVKGEK